MNLLSSQVPRKQKHGIITTLISSFIGLAYEGVSSFLHHRRNMALHMAIRAMENRVNIQHNKLTQLDNSMLMHSVYNTKTLEKINQYCAQYT